MYLSLDRRRKLVAATGTAVAVVLPRVAYLWWVMPGPRLLDRWTWPCKGGKKKEKNKKRGAGEREKGRESGSVSYQGSLSQTPVAGISLYNPSQPTPSPPAKPLLTPDQPLAHIFQIERGKKKNIGAKSVWYMKTGTEKVPLPHDPAP